MKIYLVGGAVRDQLLGLPVREKDYVVVGATVQDMLAKGFRQVGKDFPVFLHPETKEEYALARMERKVGLGYTGFTFDTSSSVTLAEDLKRRDLTINAIAQDANGELNDPYNGQEDLKKKILRHVSPAFSEDPVRILRIARFAARFGDFHIAPETTELMRQMTQAGEVDALVAERVWKEFERALSEKNPERFFEVLESCDAMKILFPSIRSQGIEMLIRSVKQTEDLKIRFAVLLNDNSVEEIKKLCERYRVPSDYRDLALLVSMHLSTYKNVQRLLADEILNLLQQTDAFRRSERFEGFLQACEICSSESSMFLMKCFVIAKAVDVQAIAASGVSGKDIALKIAEERTRAIASIL